MVADKMVWTNGTRTKWYWTKWHGQNGTRKNVKDKTVPKEITIQ